MIWLLAVLLCCLVLPSPCLGDRIALSAPEQALVFQRAVETSEYIVVARVTAQAELRGSLWPRTRNDLKVSRFLKGSPTPDSVLYSEWRISGDSVYLETSPPCCRGQKVIVQRLPWPAVVEDLSR